MLRKLLKWTTLSFLTLGVATLSLVIRLEQGKKLIVVSFNKAHADVPFGSGYDGMGADSGCEGCGGGGSEGEGDGGC